MIETRATDDFGHPPLQEDEGLPGVAGSRALDLLSHKDGEACEKLKERNGWAVRCCFMSQKAKCYGYWEDANENRQYREFLFLRSCRACKKQIMLSRYWYAGGVKTHWSVVALTLHEKYLNLSKGDEKPSDPVESVRTTTISEFEARVKRGADVCIEYLHTVARYLTQ